MNFKTKILALSLIAISFQSCTTNQPAKYYGGNQTIVLKPNHKFINITWKEDDLWILTKQDSNLIPSTYIFSEKSSFGLLQGTIEIREVK